MIGVHGKARGRALVFLLVSLLGIPLAAADPEEAPAEKPAEKPALQILDQTPHYLLPEGRTLVARIDFRWRDDLAKKPPVVHVRSVEFGEEVQPSALAQATTVAVEKPAADGYLTLRLAIDLSSFALEKRHGAYTVHLQGHPPAVEQEDSTAASRAATTNERAADPPVTKPAFEQTLILTRPKAAFAAPADLIIEQTHLWGLWPHSTAPTLRIESNSSTAPTDIRVTEKGQPRIGDRATAGKLGYMPEGAKGARSFDTLTSALADGAGDHALDLDIRRRYGLGTATGTLEISSPDADPVTLDYTVKTRQPRWVIWLIAFIGLGLGFLVRILWQQRIEKSRALLTLNAILRRITRLRGRFDHQKYQDDLTAVEDGILALAERTRGRSPFAAKPAEAKPPTPGAPTPGAIEGILAEAKTLQTDIKSALEAADTRRNELSAKVGPLWTLTETPWTLPPKLESAVEASKPGWRETVRLLDVGSLNAAEILLRDTREHLAEEVHEGLAAWRQPLHDGLDLVVSLHPHRLPPDVAAPFKTGRDEIIKALKAGQTDKPEKDRKVAIETDLEKAHVAMQQATSLIDQARRELMREVLRVRRTLSGAGLLHPVETEAALDAAVAYFEAISPAEVSPDPTAGYATLVTAIGDGLAEIVKAIRGEIHHVAATDAVNALLTDGDYEAAAKQALNPPPPQQQTGKKKWTGDDRDRFFALPSTAPARGTTILHHRAARAPDALHIEAWRLKRQIAADTFLRFVVIALALAFTAVLLYEEVFVGTVADWGKVLLWAFTTDIAAETLVTQASGAVGATPAAENP